MSKDIDDISYLPLVQEHIDNGNIIAATRIFSGKLYESDFKLDALNLFVVKVKDSIRDEKLSDLSELAAIFAGEPPFKDEYEQICRAIDRILKKRF